MRESTDFPALVPTRRWFASAFAWTFQCACRIQVQDVCGLDESVLLFHGRSVPVKLVQDK